MKAKGHPLFFAAIARLTTKIERNILVLDHVSTRIDQHIAKCERLLGLTVSDVSSSR